MNEIPEGYDNDLDDDQSAFYQEAAEAGIEPKNFHFPTKENMEVLKTRLSLTVETMKECERRRKIAHAKAERWDDLKRWLNNLMLLKTVSVTEKKGLQIALNVMDRIEEGES